MIQPREGREEKPFGWIVQNAQARWKDRNEKTGKNFDEAGVHRTKRTVDTMLLRLVMIV